MLSISGYHFPEKVYEGPHSLVFRGFRDADQTPVVIKILKKEYPTSRELAHFKREYQITRDLDIEGVIGVYGLERYHNSHGILLEDFGGDSVAKFLALGKLNLEDFLNLAITVSETLGHIHQRNIMHKDINPSNIVWNRATGQAKIIDFGISTVLSRETSAIQNPRVLEGTLTYMSPEQTGRMNRAVDYRTDLYSLGASFYEMLAGCHPFAARSATELVHAHLAHEPTPPSRHDAEIPAVLCRIVLKLLAKAPEDRYQTAFGVAADLRRCRESLRENGFIADFDIGLLDISNRFQIPEKLYGRDAELKKLREAFERTSQGAAEIILVTGYSGIGKSSLVQEIHKPIVATEGYFISGKFDQFKRNIPYASLIQAFRELVRQLLTESGGRIKAWEQKLQRALGPNGQIIVAVIPEVELIIGPQGEVPDLSPAESENRFNLVFESFVKTFAGPEHPLVLFLDDLQWADSSSLKLIERFAVDIELEHMLIIGAFRDNEVDATHPLAHCIEEIEKSGPALERITLGPLSLEHVNQLIAETLHRNPEDTLSLARLCLDKTDGNPFFLNQFLHALHREGCIELKAEQQSWHWDLGRIQHHEITDNVAELMVGNIQKLAAPTQRMLTLAACIGNRFDLKALAIVSERPPMECAQDLWKALEEGFILPLDDNYKLIKELEDARVEYRFLHDQVQQAAYSLVEEAHKKELHLRIGRLLAASIGEKDREDQIFDIVNHLNYGRSLIEDREEKENLARLNLSAGRKAKSAAAFGPAYRYLETGLLLLEADCWEKGYELTLELYVEAAEAAYLTADFDQMEAWADAVFQHAANLLDRVRVYEVKIFAYLSNNRPDKAVKTGLDVLRLLGVQFPANPGNLSILRSLIQTKIVLAGKKIEELSDLPVMKDPAKLAAVRIMSSIVSAAYITKPELFVLLTFKQVRLSVRHGNAKASAFAYTAYGVMLCGVLGDIENGYRFGRMSLALLKQLNATKYKAKIIYSFHTFIFHWKKDGKDMLRPMLTAYQAGLENGDMEYAGWSVFVYATYSYLTGRELTRLNSEIAPYRNAINAFKQEMAVTYTDLCRQAVLNMMGRAADPTVLIGSSYDEEDMADFHRDGKDRLANFCLYFHKLSLKYLFGQYAPALEFAAKAESFMESGAGKMLIPFFYFFDSLTRLAVMEKKTRSAFGARVKANQKKLKKWAAVAPMNHRHKYDLVEAERARVAGRDAEAQELYERAGAGARQSDALLEEALAYELTAQFHFQRKRDQIGRFYLHNAQNAYQRWGAQAKVRHLQERYPEFATLGASRQTLTSLGASQPITSTSDKGSDEVLDLASVMQAAEALSSEIVLEKLLDKMLRIAIENAGAQRGFLIMEREGSLVVEAEAEVDNPTLPLLEEAEDGEPDQPRFPRAVLQYVLRTRKDVVLHDASTEGTFANDSYIRRVRPKSVLCTPLLKQGQLKAILYLENNLTNGAFTPDRLEVLKLLSSQAAISIENAGLYADLEKYSELLEQKVTERTLELRRKNEQLLSSIRYAQHIQEAILPDLGDLRASLPQSFVLFRPRDLVSGDFYWFSNTEEEILVAVVDCTGHGVPGALLSMMGNSLLNQIVREQKVTEPAEVLRQLDAMIRDALKQEGREESGDGMDLCFCRINPEERKLSFTGSRRPLYLARGGKLIEFKGDRKPVGGRRKKTPRPFTQQEIDIRAGDHLYLSSDGFADQVSPRGKKYGSRRLKKFLGEIAALDISSQERALNAELEKHQGKEAQLDDITLLGVRI